LAEVCKWFHWHNHTEQIRIVVKTCKKCQLVKQIRSIKFNVEDFKKSQYVTYLKKLHLILQAHFYIPMMETNILWLWLTTILNGARQKPYLIIQQQLAIFWKQKYFRYGILKFILIDNDGE
jgi:hypothetical protein